MSSPSPLSQYNQIAGQNLERLAALSDGVFAVAMTLLLLDLRAPAADAIASEAALGQALLDLAPRLLVYLLSFVTLGIFWVGQQTQLNQMERSNRHFAWINLGFLFAVTLTPFSTGLMAEFIQFRVALLAYWLNILLLGLLLFASWRYARHAHLAQDGMTEAVFKSVEYRILIAQSLYAFGALLSVILNTYWSIGFIVLVQLHYAVAPRYPWLSASPVSGPS